ncbi:MAG: alpha/beta hydrolase [Candidatus Obscuribacterales bacterium]|nr:alpha/beta hydrolase [Steroidobacteraceae bacterium]
MASWQAHVANFILRRTVRAKLVRSPTPETLRKAFGTMRPAVPRDCAATQAVVGGIRGEWLRTRRGDSRGTLLYLHGGAHVACSPVTHRPLTSAFAKHEWQVFAPDYRLAPEHRFPAGLHDVVAAYRGLLADGVEPKSLVVAGDSAGGNLALALCLSLRAANVPMPAALALFSPVTDFAWTGESIRTNSDSCAMFSHQILPHGTQFYLGGHNPRDPLVSPVYADLSGLPPMLVHASEHEILRDDSVRIAERAQQAGVHVEFKTWPNVPHVWQMAHRWMPEGRESLELVHEFLRRYVPG